MGNERTRVTCKSCEAWNASQRSTCDPCLFIFQMQTKTCTKYFDCHIYAQATNNPSKVEKIDIHFFVTWLVAFIGKYLPQFSNASLHTNVMGVLICNNMDHMRILRTLMVLSLPEVPQSPDARLALGFCWKGLYKYDKQS